MAKKVFLVDDENWSLLAYQKVFPWQAYGYEVGGLFENAQDALAAIVRDPPALVLTDIRMPGISGLELIRMAREEGAAATVFVVVSGYSEFEYARKALKIGAADYLLKPVSYRDAEELLKKLNERHENKGETPPEVRAPATSNDQFNALLDYIRAHYAEPLQLKVLAQRFFLNATYCSELFNNKLGVGFLHYLHQVRIEQSLELLRMTNLTIAEIAQRTGFSDEAHFHRVFKKLQNETPLHYRNSFRKK